MTRSMQHQMRRAFHMILTIAVFCGATPSWGQQETAAEKLARAIRFYEAGAYEEALPVLEATDPDLLSAQDQELLQEQVKLTNRAVAGYRVALGDLARAEDAIAEENFNLAKALLDRVLQNQFATDDLRVEARDDLATIARGERDRILLASAAAQENPTQNQPVTTRSQPTTANTRPTGRKPVVNDFSPMQQANMLVRHGNQAMQRGSNQIADDYFRQALELVPGHPDATNGLRQLKMHQRVESGASGDGITLIDRIKQRNAILWQRAVAVFRTAERDIQEFVANDRYDEAQRSLQLARETIESARQYADPISNYHGLKAELAAVREQVDTREQTYNEQRAVQLRQKLQEKEKERRDSLEVERARQIDLLMEEVDNRVDDRDFFGAAQVVRQILVIDPKDAQAARLIEEFEDIANVRSQQDSRVLLEREMRDIFMDVEESKIPWHQDLNYPDNWQELIRSPYRQTPGEFPLDESDGVFEESFRGRIPDISFNQVPLEQAIERLSDERDINIVPNWPDLASAGITRSTPVTLKLRNVTTKTALTQVVDQLQGLSLTPLNFAVRGGIITVATENFLNRDVFVRVYAVQDLIHPIEQYDDAPQFDLRRPQRDRRNASRRDKTIFARDEELTDEDPLEGRTDNTARRELDDLVGLIEEHVAPLSWETHGGPARIHARLDGNLVISQTAASHQEIFNLLDQLRQDRAVQIAIEARFLTVSSNFLEDMGIDLNIVLNNGNAGFDQALVGNNLAVDPATGGILLLPRGFSRLGFTPSTAGFGNATANNQIPDQPFLNPVFVPRATGGSNLFTPFPISSGSRGFTDPGTETSDVPGSFAGTNLAPALQIAGSFLDNIQVDFLLRATQADARTSTMIAPKLILTNGQQAWIAVTEQQNFVSELDPVVATGAAAQRPVIDTLDTGAVLNVQATASPDRRYVMMNLQPGVGRLVAVNTFQFSGGPITGVGAPGFVQLPIVQRQQVKTTVTVPDGGTLLVGGQKLTFEKESDAGVPVLSKIPLLKRLYSSRAIIKDEQVLLILIKPQILIQEELEEKANPMLGSLR